MSTPVSSTPPVPFSKRPEVLAADAVFAEEEREYYATMNNAPTAEEKAQAVKQYKAAEARCDKVKREIAAKHEAERLAKEQARLKVDQDDKADPEGKLQRLAEIERLSLIETEQRAAEVERSEKDATDTKAALDDAKAALDTVKAVPAKRRSSVDVDRLAADRLVKQGAVQITQEDYDGAVAKVATARAAHAQALAAHRIASADVLYQRRVLLHQRAQQEFDAFLSGPLVQLLIEDELLEAEARAIPDRSRRLPLPLEGALGLEFRVAQHLPQLEARRYQIEKARSAPLPKRRDALLAAVGAPKKDS